MRHPFIHVVAWLVCSLIGCERSDEVPPKETPAETPQITSSIAVEDPPPPQVVHESAGDAVAEVHQRIARLQQLGHRPAASRLAQQLVQRGEATVAEVLDLIERRGNAFSIDQSLDKAIGTANSSPPLPSSLRRTRELIQQEAYAEALKVLGYPNSWKTDDAEQSALVGLALAEDQRFGEMQSWKASATDAAQAFSEYWSALGTWALRCGDAELSLSSLVRAVSLDPTSERDYRRLSRCLSILKQSSAAADAMQRALSLRQMKESRRLYLHAPTNQKVQQQVADGWIDLDFGYEYLQWQQLHADQSSKIDQIKGQRRLLQSNPSLAAIQARSATLNLPIKDLSSVDAESWKRLNAEQAEQVLPDDVATKMPESETAKPSDPLRFVDVAETIGLNFQYRNASPPVEKFVRLHESLGGGIGVIDYDCDGWPDVYLGQGGEPREDSGNESNRLFRNLRDRCEDVAIQSQTMDFGYTTGIAVGDLNQDGWPDLLVGSLNRNRLLINQGDGTFAEDVCEPCSHESYTTSMAIADLDGDGLSDIVEANYVDDPAMYQPNVPQIDGVPQAISPASLRHAKDRVWYQDASARWTTELLEPAPDALAGSALGLIVTTLGGQPGNVVLVGNDVWPNRLWRRDSDEPAAWSESAMVNGLALDSSGNATASMGIAAGDFDRNGRIDFHIANFDGESSSLFMQLDNGQFLDLAPRYRLAKSTVDKVGFGSQCFDADHDGWLDLFVVNGHIDDYRSTGHGFKMRPQMFRGGEEGFAEQQEFEPENEFWHRPALGRTLAKLDWNRDGSVDLIANHLDQPVALLINQTISTGRHVCFHLVGTQCERDAIGAKVIVKTSGHSLTGWRTAGDGYLCTNETMMHFGLGDAEVIDGVIVHWPDGTQQVFDEIELDRRYLIVQGESKVAWPLDASR